VVIILNYKYAFLLTALAGLSTLIGSFLIFIKNKDKNKIIVMTLSFAMGVMIAVSFFDLLPNAFLLLDNFYLIPKLLIIAIIMVIGILFGIIIDKYLPAQDNQLYRVGIMAMLAIIIHNIPEGMATFMTTTNNLKLGLYLAFTIALHNIPEGISISIPLFYATGNKKKALSYTFISGLSELFGAFLAFIFLKNYVNPLVMALLYAFIAGIMVQISLYELLPSIRKYKKKKHAISCFFLGTIIILISHYLLA
jgi:zinc transporter, ZIP family